MSWRTPENLSADGIRAVVTGTAGIGKAIADDGASGLAWATVGGAPTDATYVAIGTNATLTNERVLTGTTNQIAITDNGAGGTVVLSTPQNLHTAATPQFASIELGHASDTTLTRVSAGVVAVEGTTLQSLLSSSNKLGLAAGGTNADLSATGGSGHVLKQNSVGGAITTGTVSATVTAMCCQSSKSSSQAIFGATYTDVTFNVDDVDTDAIHDAGGSSADFVVPTGGAGKWRLHVCAATLSTASGTFRIKLKKNGTDTYENYFRQGEAAYYVHHIAWVLSAADGDSYKIQVYDNSAATLLSTADVSGMSFRISFERLGG